MKILGLLAISWLLMGAACDARRDLMVMHSTPEGTEACGFTSQVVVNATVDTSVVPLRQQQITEGYAEASPAPPPLDCSTPGTRIRLGPGGCEVCVNE